MFQTGLQGPVGGTGGGELRAVAVQGIQEVSTWTDEGFLRGIKLTFRDGTTRAFGTLHVGTGDKESFSGVETFIGLDVFPTAVPGLGGRIAGFTLYWTEPGAPFVSSRQFGVLGNLATAQFTQPGSNRLSHIVIAAGPDIEAMGVIWAAPGGRHPAPMAQTL